MNYSVFLILKLYLLLKMLKSFFEIFNKTGEINREEILAEYSDYFNSIFKRGGLKWPFVTFPLINKIFLNLISSKTKYDSFSNMLIYNNYN